MPNSKPYSVVDRRRSFAKGAPPPKPIPGDLPAISAATIQGPLDKVGKFYKTRMERDIRDGRLTPGNYWVDIQGLMKSAMQTHKAIAFLIADRQEPYTFPAQADVLARGLLECLANIMALGEDRRKLRLFGRDGYVNDFRHYQWLKGHFGHLPQWQRNLQEWTAMLSRWAGRYGLTEAQANDPERHVKARWPTLGQMLWEGRGRKRTDFVSGSRWDALEYLYGSLYGHASALAHQRIHAVKAAYYADEPDKHKYPGRWKSNVAFHGFVLMASIFAELEGMTGFEPIPDLRVLWERLRTQHDDVQAVYDLRYRQLLKMH